MASQYEKYKISVIVPIYNTEKYLRQCVDSILNQTHHNLEVFLVDDGSTDSTPQICDSYGEKDERVKVIHKKQGGCWQSRNMALDIASGDYILMVDSDDFMTPDLCETLLGNAVEHHTPLSMCSYCFYYDETGAEELRTESETKVRDSLEIMHVFQTDERIEMIVPWGKLYKRELYDGIRYPDRTPDDEYVTYKLLWKAGKVSYTSRQLYFFRQRKDSLTHTLSPKKLMDYLDSLLERYDYFRTEVQDEDLIEETALFCVDELCNIHFKELTHDKYIYYHNEYVRLYKLCGWKKRISLMKRVKYFAAAKCPGMLIMLWKLKKRLCM